MKTKALIMGLLISNFAFAGTVTPRIVCPNLTQDGSSLLSKIQTLQDQLKPTAECQSIADKISVINEVIADDHWKKFKNSVSGSQSESLEGDDIDKLRDMTEKVSYSIAETVQRLAGGGNCVDAEDQAGFLSTLSGVTKEVSTLIGSTTGPYGMAISVGGNVLSGAISGIDKLIKSRKRYSFNPKNKEEEILFMNQFCAFSEIQLDINDMNNLEQQKVDLLKLAIYLEIKRKTLVGTLTNNHLDIINGVMDTNDEAHLTQMLNDLMKNTNDSRDRQNATGPYCSLCHAYNLAWKAMGSGSRLVSAIKADANIVDYDMNPDNQRSFARCKEIHRAFHSPNSNTMKFYSLLDNYKNPHMDEEDKSVINESLAMGDVYANKFLRGRDCAAQPRDSILSMSIEFNDTMRDEILPLNEEIFKQQMGKFQRDANRLYKKQLGDYIANTLSRQKWIAKERNRIDTLIHKIDNRVVDLSHINEQHAFLQESIIDKSLPIYLRYLVRNNLSLYSHFQIALTQFENKNTTTQINRRFRSSVAQPGQYDNHFSQPIESIEQLVNLFVEHSDKNEFVTRNLNQTSSFSQRVSTLQNKLENSTTDLARTYLSQQRRVTKKLDDAIIKSEVIIRYCEYAKYISHNTQSVDKVCNDSVKKILAALEKLKPHYDTLMAMQNFDQWANINLNIQSSRIANYATKIADWNNLGDERFLQNDGQIIQRVNLADEIAKDAQEVVESSELFDQNQ